MNSSQNNASETMGKTLAIANDDAMGTINGTGQNDIISIRTVSGKSTQTNAGQGNDTVILYGSDDIPEGNYHQMLADLKQSPIQTATQYFNATHTVDLGSGSGDGADSLSLISELDAQPTFMLKHTGKDGRINGKGVAGENGKAYDHWAGVFGFIDIVNFDPTNDTLNLLGHTTTLGESFTKGGDFYQTVYSEQNANNQTGPRAGAAHDDTFLGLLKFEGGADSAEAITDAINLEGMKNYVIRGLGKEVYEGDPTSNQSSEAITDEPIMSFALVNSDTNQIVEGYETIANGAEIDLNGLDLNQYSVVAQINSDHIYGELVESVKFNSNLGKQTENIKPYALFGDIKGDFKGKAPETGEVTLTATAYSKDGGRGQAIGSMDLSYTIIDTTAPLPEPMPGETMAIANEAAMGTINGTDKDDIISIRTVSGKSTQTNAGNGHDTVILYGADDIPEGNYHQMLADLKQSPIQTATQYFNATHTVDLGAGDGDGADSLSLISELDAQPKFMLKHTSKDGRINGKGVAGENGQAYDHWAGIFGFVDIANFDPKNDTLNLLGHTTTLGKSFTKDGDFYQTVYSEQNANNQTGPRAGAAHDDTFLGLLKFEGGADSANAITDAINLEGMKNYVIRGLGKEVYEGDPTSNQSSEAITDEPIMSFALVNSDTNQIVEGYETIANGAEIDLNGLDLNQYSVVAQINSDHIYGELVESVKFDSNLGKQTENIKPYALFGDIKGNFRGKAPEAGEVTLSATAYSKNGGKGQAIGSMDLSYTIVDTGDTSDNDTPGNGGMPDAQAVLDLSKLSAYGGRRHNKAISQTLSNDNTAVRMEGNGWRKLGVNYRVTPETMLKFEFRSDAQGEIHSIGFDNNNRIQRGDRKTGFQLFGVQDWGNDNFRTYVDGAGWQSFEIPVGEFLTGKKKFLTFGNDHDIANPDATSEFRNIKLYEMDGGIGDSSDGQDMMADQMANPMMASEALGNDTASLL
ncbi:MAG: hypothetical protein AAGD25_24450 [Cyanobacteria bacterium P01_F01_bin.150]